MDVRLREMAELLRRNGVRVGPGEIADAARSLALLGVGQRAVVRAALRACLVKRAADVAVFDAIFDLYFSGVARAFDAVEASLVKAVEDAGLLEGDELAMVAATLDRLLGQMSPLAQAVLQGDLARVASLFQGAALQIDFARLQGPMQQGFYSRRLLAAAGADQAWRELAQLAPALLHAGLPAEKVELVSGKLAEAMRAVEAAARERVRLESRLRAPPSPALADRPFAQLTAEEREQTLLAVRRLAERLKTRLVRRQRARRRGALNVRRTLRRNLSWGGVPAKLAFRARRPERPDVIVLCDVSDSVRHVARMMLLFVHTLQSLFNRVRTFLFVSDVGEVTEQLRGVDARQALDLAIAAQAIDVYANSNYGRVFATFATRHLGSVTRRTTLLVIGDGRNNYNETHLWALEEMRRKAHRLIWICPEEEASWGLGDSAMRQYARVCDRVAAVQSLSDLARVADVLLPRA